MHFVCYDDYTEVVIMSKVYKGLYTSEISFPLGGIGTGSIGLAGNGSLIDWEINNRPNRESINSFTNFAIKAENHEKVVDCRLLQGDIVKDFMGGMHKGNHSWGYGHGPNRGTMSGMRHFSDWTFKGEFPFASINFSDKKFPGDVTLEAFNPFIPSDDLSSSLPAGFFSVEVVNTSQQTLDYTVALSVTNPLNAFGKHEAYKEHDKTCVILNSRHKRQHHLRHGNVTIGTNAKEAHYQTYWYRGGWFDNVTMFINDFGTYGPMHDRKFNQRKLNKRDTSTVTGKITLKPGERKTVKFIISWYVPNYWKYWVGTLPTKIPKWKNYYASLFAHSKDVLTYGFEHWDELYQTSKLFKDSLLSSDLPEVVLDAIQGNLATLKSTTCLRLTNGEFYGWEGVNKTWGSCEGSCQHVWNYAYALPFLFPKLERSMRELEMKYNLKRDGKMHFRLMLPLGNMVQPFRACVDGQMGTVMKLYREWKLSGNTAWLKQYWPDIKKMIAYAWHPKNKDQWDREQTGVMMGRQHHTLDVELFGANSWLTGFYHGALLAGIEMAKVFGEDDLAEMYQHLLTKGRKYIETKTFNGEYFIQEIDVKNESILHKYGGNRSLNMSGGYWDSETKEIKYQIGQGCEIDQVVADWHSELMGLPFIFNQAQRKKSLESLYHYNFINLSEIDNPCRVFGVNNEKGLIMCQWPEAIEKPKISVPYTQEVMSGFEYAAACNMLQCDMEVEALNVVEAIRDRYDGHKRNPWAEIECGASYARAMASYSFLLTYSGFKYDLTKKMIGFMPKKKGQYFWSIDGAWGQVQLNEKQVVLNLHYGQLALHRYTHDFKKVSHVKLNGKSVKFINMTSYIKIDVEMKAGDLLVLDA